MVNLDIIEPIKKPTGWVNGFAIVEKSSGNLRICLDTQLLNNAIKRQHLRLPTAEKKFWQMSGACFFSKLDASSGYWQIKVGEESSHLSAFGTSLGRCRIKRLPYDVLVSIDLWTICFTMSHILVPSEKRLSFLYRDIVSLNYMLPCMVLMEKNKKIIN